MKRLIHSPSGDWGLSGVYMYRHLRSGKFIMGTSIDLGGCRSVNLSKLRTGVHTNKELQQLYRDSSDMEFFCFLTENQVEAWVVEAELREQMHGNPLFIDRLVTRQRRKHRLEQKLQERAPLDVAAIAARHAQSPLWVFMK